MSNRPIGVFDAGVGGLAAAKELRRLLPNEEILLYCDMDNIPGESATRDDMAALAGAAVTLLAGRDVKALVCANAIISALTEAESLPLPEDVLYLDSVRPAARAACGVSAQGRIGVVADTAVIRSGAFAKAIHSIQAGAKVLGNAAPLLIPLAEHGQADLSLPATRQLLEKHLAPLARERIDTLLLGGAELAPLVDSAGELFHYKIPVVEPAASLAHDLQTLLCERGLLAQREPIPGIRCLLPSGRDRFERAAALHLGEDIPCRIEAL